MTAGFACRSFNLGGKLLLVLHNLAETLPLLGGFVLMCSESELLLLIFIVFTSHMGLGDPQGQGPHLAHLCIPSLSTCSWYMVPTVG